GDGPRTGPSRAEPALLPSRLSPAPRIRGTSCPPRASSAFRAPWGSLEIRLERCPHPRSGTVQEHPLIRLLNRESVTPPFRRPSLHIAEPQDSSQIRWQRVDDGPESLPELFGQETPLR